MNQNDVFNYAISALSHSILTTTSIVALLLAIITLWFPARLKLPIIFFIVYLLMGLLSGHIHFIAIPIIFLLLILFCIATSENFSKILRLASGVGAFLLSIFFIFHAVPGIINVKIIDHQILSYKSKPFTLYFNLDKPLLGLFILFFSNKLIQNLKQLKCALLPIVSTAIIGFCIILGLAFILQYIRLDIKFNSIFYLWAIDNLFFTVVAEEALCRGFVLYYLDIYCKRYQYGSYISLLVVSLFFGILHYTGGWKYVLLATVAGIVYGRVYQKTNRIESSIITHFLLNVLHFLFFTYPALT